MIKKIIEILKKIKCRLSCCYQSQCSLNDENNLNAKYIEDECQSTEEFVDTHSGF